MQLLYSSHTHHVLVVLVPVVELPSENDAPPGMVRQGEELDPSPQERFHIVLGHVVQADVPSQAVVPEQILLELIVLQHAGCRQSGIKVLSPEEHETLTLDVPGVLGARPTKGFVLEVMLLLLLLLILRMITIIIILVLLQTPRPFK